MVKKVWNRREFEEGFFTRNPPGSLEKLKGFTVGVAGAGGLGSNIAVSLVRSGVCRLVVADFDVVEMSNLNRQQYLCTDVGKPKVRVLRRNLLKINPFAEIEAVNARVGPENVAKIFGKCDILLEAFDRAEAKVMLVEAWLKRFPDRRIVIGSGVAGAGRNDEIRTQYCGALIICGDQMTESDPENGLVAPRVAAVANLQANAAIEIMLGGGKK